MSLIARRWFWLALLPLAASAQFAPEDPDWKELDARTPPAFSTDRLLPIEMPRHLSLKFGVDPATLSIGSDGIVRYVVVAINSSGSVNAAYEGIRCFSWQVKTYARLGTNNQWRATPDAQWKDMSEHIPSRHARALASQGVCNGRTVQAESVEQIIRALKRKNQDY